MIQGIWMWPSNVYKYGAEKIISRLKRAGFTDIYFLTKGLSGKTSFLGNIAPSAFDRDVLKETLDKAHQYGIRVHAWFTSASDEYYKSIHPESGREHFKRGKDRELISFKDDAYLSYLKSIVDEVIESYPIDGIHLDYIRYNHMLYGWDEKDLQSYVDYGANKEELFQFIEKTFFSDDKDFSICEAYKNGNQTLKAFFESRKADVQRFARHILKGVRDIRPSLILSAAVMPEGAYKDASFADLHYGQVYDELSPLFDYLAVMSYSKAYDKESPWLLEIGQNLTEKHIPFVLGIQTYDHVGASAIQSDILSAKRASSRGIVLFREGECAIIYHKDGLFLFNDTDDTITRIELIENGKKEIIDASIAPGEIYPLKPCCLPDCILLYSTDKPVCVFYDKYKME
ncbi:MAG: family 10 glycosylhydrolase [Clostridia bacterium]|nr:family 10 glycosylhydrolase [Clostridia bacterium]